jgi:hypothetical protein
MHHPIRELYNNSTYAIAPNQLRTYPSPSRFFSNKGEVAGLFTVVGLAALVTFTCIRCHCAEKFDRDVAEAAMQAAATSHSANFDDYGYGSNDNPYTGYSVESHGTYGQPAVSHGGHVESYVMRDVSVGMGMGGSRDTGAGAGYKYATGVDIGAAGGGVAMQRARSQKTTR